MKFIIISPAYNEQEHIRKTLESVIKQSILPNQWIIVNDGSTDETAEIVKEYSDRYNWITLLNCEKEQAEFGAHAVILFYKGMNACKVKDWDFVLKLDSDLEIERTDFIEFQLKQFNDCETLGICSGITYSIINGQKALTTGRHYWRTGGAMKFYRRSCFDEIGGLVPIYGWDGLDEYKAMYNGWKTRTFFELHVNHLGKARANARNLDEAVFYKRGISFYKRGYPIEFVMLKSFAYVFVSPKKAIKFFKGYISSKLNKEQRYVTISEMRFIRKIQYLRIMDSLITKELL